MRPRPVQQLLVQTERPCRRGIHHAAIGRQHSSSAAPYASSPSMLAIALPPRQQGYTLARHVGCAAVVVRPEPRDTPDIDTFVGHFGPFAPHPRGYATPVDHDDCPSAFAHAPPVEVKAQRTHGQRQRPFCLLKTKRPQYTDTRASPDSSVYRVGLAEVVGVCAQRPQLLWATNARAEMHPPWPVSTRASALSFAPHARRYAVQEISHAGDTEVRSATAEIHPTPRPGHGGPQCLVASATAEIRPTPSTSTSAWMRSLRPSGDPPRTGRMTISVDLFRPQRR